MLTKTKTMIVPYLTSKQKLTIKNSPIVKDIFNYWGILRNNNDGD